MNAVRMLQKYTENMKEHANSEIRQLTKKILDLISR